MRRLPALEGHPTVGRFVIALVVHVDVIRIGRIGGHTGVVERPVHDAACVADHLPARTEIVGAIQALIGVGGLDQRVDPVRHIGRHGQIDLSNQSSRQAFGQVLPVVAAVSRLPDSVLSSRSLHARDNRPRPTLPPPHCGVDFVRIGRVDLQVDRTDGVRGEQHLIPAAPRVRRAVHAAIRCLCPGVPECGDIGHIRVIGINLNSCKLSHFH